MTRSGQGELIVDLEILFSPIKDGPNKEFGKKAKLDQIKCFSIKGIPSAIATPLLWLPVPGRSSIKAQIIGSRFILDPVNIIIDRSFINLNLKLKSDFMLLVYKKLLSKYIKVISPLSTTKAKFYIGQLIHHKLFDYRGVVIDVDPNFHGSEEWYSGVAFSKPPKEDPWYHVLADSSYSRTYVAQRNLEPDDSREPIIHPDIQIHFRGLTSGSYTPRYKKN